MLPNAINGTIGANGMGSCPRIKATVGVRQPNTTPAIFPSKDAVRKNMVLISGPVIGCGNPAI